MSRKKQHHEWRGTETPGAAILLISDDGLPMTDAHAADIEMLVEREYGLNVRARLLRAGCSMCACEASSTCGPCRDARRR